MTNDLPSHHDSAQGFGSDPVQKHVVPVSTRIDGFELVRHRVFDRLVEMMENRRLAAIGGHLEIIRDVPDLLYRRMSAASEEHLIFEARIVELPSFVENAVCCETLRSEFGTNNILACDGFTLQSSLLLLDVDEKLVRRGFMLPVYESGLITGLKVFRRPTDEHPFILRTRGCGKEGVIL